MSTRRQWVILAFVFLAEWIVVPSAARAGTALLFDGTNDVVSVAGFGNVAPTNEVTLEFWQRVDRVKSQAAFILSPDQGMPVENPPGAFQFSHTNAPGQVSRFYRLRSP